MKTVFAISFLNIPKEENGQPSRLIGITFEDKKGEQIIWYPKYRDFFQLLEQFLIKEDYRYPRNKGFQGRDYLISGLLRLGYGSSLEEVLKITETPEPHNPLPVDLEVVA